MQRGLYLIDPRTQWCLRCALEQHEWVPNFEFESSVRREIGYHQRVKEHRQLGI